MIKVRKGDNGNWTIEVSKILGIFGSIVMLAIFIWGIAMSWVITTRVQPIEEKIAQIEAVAINSKETTLSLRKDFVAHCNEQAEQFGYIKGQLAILIKAQ